MFHARIWAKLLSYSREHALLAPGDHVLAAVSGGPDSVCLAHYLHLLSRRLRLRVSLLHMHHGLRGGEADRDNRLVEKLGGKLGLPVETVRIPVAAFAKSERRSLEDAGRILRYRTLARHALRLGCNKVATGHQLDDAAETFILNLLRGTKAEGLAGIPPRRPLAQHGRARIDVIRPLLCLSRREVRDYLKHHNLRFATDRTNRDPRFTRNWVRLEVLPLLEERSPEIRSHLAQIAQDLRGKLLPGKFE